MPGQQMRLILFFAPSRLVYSFVYRRKNVRRKLNAMALEFVDKVVLLVDGILSLACLSLHLF
jgi:hypothetical protein